MASNWSFEFRMYGESNGPFLIEEYRQHGVSVVDSRLCSECAGGRVTISRGLWTGGEFSFGA
jgi:hypothetical protein